MMNASSDDGLRAAFRLGDSHLARWSMSTQGVMDHLRGAQRGADAWWERQLEPERPIGGAVMLGARHEAGSRNTA